jgi:hypothetical protein
MDVPVIPGTRLSQSEPVPEFVLSASRLTYEPVGSVISPRRPPEVPCQGVSRQRVRTRLSVRESASAVLESVPLQIVKILAR